MGGKWWPKEVDHWARKKVEKGMAEHAMKYLSATHQYTALLSFQTAEDAALLHWIERYARAIAEEYDLPVPGYAREERGVEG